MAREEGGTGRVAILLKFDAGLNARIQREKEIVRANRGGTKTPRTEVIFELLLEALNARAEARGEVVPEVSAVGGVGEGAASGVGEDSRAEGA